MDAVYLLVPFVGVVGVAIYTYFDVFRNQKDRNQKLTEEVTSLIEGIKSFDLSTSEDEIEADEEKQEAENTPESKKPRERKQSTGRRAYHPIPTFALMERSPVQASAVRRHELKAGSQDGVLQVVVRDGKSQQETIVGKIDLGLRVKTVRSVRRSARYLTRDMPLQATTKKE